MRKIASDMNQTKQLIKDNQGKELHFKINLGRNRFVEKQATICDVYNGLFTIKVNETEKIESFSYSDFMCNKIMIIEH